MPSTKLTASGDQAAAVADKEKVGVVGNPALPGFGLAAPGSEALSKNASAFSRMILQNLVHPVQNAF
jgi:hypothetical protein